jgi:NAD-dependent dihydropyrimidine dehydrogenase PreA subunit
MAVIIVKEECETCGTCIPMCPNSAIIYNEENGETIVEIDEDECIECLECIEYCIRGAIKEV